MHSKNKYYEVTAHLFFKSKYRFLIASIAGINDIDYVYKKHKSKNPNIKLSGKRKGGNFI